MSRDNVNSKDEAKQDITWQDVIRDSEALILEHRGKIKELRKSLKFFKKKASEGIPYPGFSGIRHKHFS